jgi:clan AA aspartic protease
MKRGIVNEYLEPRISLTFVSATGSRTEIEMVVDTAFEGFITLPRHILRNLRRLKRGTVRTVLADDSESRADYYVCTVIWNGRKRQIQVLLMDGDPLLGTEMMRNYSLSVDFVPGGTVSIRPIKAP